MAKTLVKKFGVRHAAVGRVEIPIRFDSEGNNFYVDVEKPCKLYFIHKDIVEVEKYIKKTIFDNLSIDWKPFLHVEVDLFKGRRWDNRGSDTSCSLTISYSKVDLATRLEGDAICRDRGDTQCMGQTPPRVGLVDEGIRNDDLVVKMSSLIPETVENLAALGNIHKAMEALGERIRNLMSPEKILGTLEHSASLLALPAPEKKHD